MDNRVLPASKVKAIQGNALDTRGGLPGPSCRFK
jgi:hypothetical protein